MSFSQYDYLSPLGELSKSELEDLVWYAGLMCSSSRFSLVIERLKKESPTLNFRAMKIELKWVDGTENQREKPGKIISRTYEILGDHCDEQSPLGDLGSEQ